MTATYYVIPSAKKRLGLQMQSYMIGSYVSTELFLISQYALRGVKVFQAKFLKASHRGNQQSEHVERGCEC